MMKGLSTRIELFLAIICIYGEFAVAITNSEDNAALMGLAKEWKNLPRTWSSGDPCGGWELITCSNSRIVTITLGSMGLMGQLTGDLVSLPKLQILDLSYNKGLTGSLPHDIGKLSKLTSLNLLDCGFSGAIPDSVGSLQRIVTLSLNKNRFTGQIPASIGNLKKLYWLDLTDNQLSGNIPVSNGTTSGLDLLVQTKHFHLGKNKLSGSIPPSLFHPGMQVIHILLDNNDLTGSIPSTIGLLKALEIVRLDRNSLSGSLPTNINNLTSVTELVLSNNAFTGPVPNLTGMDNLNFVDLSNNSFAATNIPEWLSSLQSLQTIMMEHTGLTGQLPKDFFNSPQLGTVVLKNNHINGTLDIDSSSSSNLKLIDLENNSISALSSTSIHNLTLQLAENPFCQKIRVNSPYCKNQAGFPYSTPVFCVTTPCTSDRVSSPSCKCAYPYTGTLLLRAPLFTVLESHYFESLQKSLLETFVALKLPVDSISLNDVNVDSFGYLKMHLAIFPAGQVYFNRTGILSIGFVFSNQTYEASEEYGPYYFLADIYSNFEGKHKSSHGGIIIGAAIGASVLLLLVLVGVVSYAYHQRKMVVKAKQQANPFVSWDSQGNNGDTPQLKGARFFSFDELQRCTDKFSETNHIGSGGYGKVYKGILADGQIVAIKRSEKGSLQGSREFKNEIELLSRVHHKNLVNLFGFCFDQGEQMLVYEFVPNGTLLDSLSGKSGIQLDWVRRLKITLGSARGLQYLHDLANPPIIHRDIKSNNILLDEHLNAKVADFGLSRLFNDSDKGYVSTQVKGTMGYLDPEYFMTNQLTEKSDVFSFGIVMLEMVTARKPIQGSYILKDINETIDRTKNLYNLSEMMDPILLSSVPILVGLEKFVDLALKCSDESGTNRPMMSEVVKEIEAILKLAGMNPNADSTSTSQSYEGSSGAKFGHNPSSDHSLF